MSEDIAPSKKSLVLSVIVATAMIFGIEMLFPRPETDSAVVSQAARTNSTTQTNDSQAYSSTEAETEVEEVEEYKMLDEATALSSARIPFKNDKVSGSIRLEGARLDNLVLLDYDKSIEDKTPITLLAPALTTHAFYTESGWLSNDKRIKTPTSKTVWTIQGNQTLAPNKDVVLTYAPEGIIYTRTISLDDNYMFTIKDEVHNISTDTVRLYNYGIVARGETPTVSGGTSHEGITGFLNDTLEEYSYTNLIDDKVKEFKTKSGWFGIADKYWMSMLILPQNDIEHNVKFSYNALGDRDLYQTDYITSQISIAAGDSYFTEHMIFAGAKEINIIDDYASLYNIKNFDRSMDFGWFYFLTKPFIYMLDFFYGLLGNMGWAIILFATLLRLVMYPIANKSYKSMAKMKQVQPKIKELQNRYKNDKSKMNQELMQLYKKEQINPLSGCLPLLIQIPVFFSLYKVLNISIELREAPFIGWIKDLSAPDPTSVFTLCGLIPIDLPSFLTIGVWPILMGITMYIQQKMSPKPADKTQAYVFMFLPIIFTFMLAHFASGLVIYWTWSNVLSILQQYMIKKSMAKDEKRK